MRTRNIVAIAFGFLGAGLAIATPYLEEQPAAFVHSMHLEEGAECSTCHVRKDGVPAPVISQEGCRECHDKGAPSYRLEKRARKLTIAFPHKLHEESGECGDCHEGIKKDRTSDGKPMVDFDGCGKCHKQNDVEVSPAACKRCHGMNMRQHRPADHKGLWLRSHGEESTWRVFDEHGQDCQTCHGADTCTTCHKETRPRSHTGVWRLRGHGLAAGWEREACKTCHETGTCVRCHRETEPLSHKGPWGSTHGLLGVQENCIVCHSAARVQTCGGCHK